MAAVMPPVNMDFGPAGEKKEILHISCRLALHVEELDT